MNLALIKIVRAVSSVHFGVHFGAFLVWGLLSIEPANAARIKDIATLRGDKGNPITGYGLVVGLSGTGDRSFDLSQVSLAQALKAIGLDPRTQKIESQNVASVMVTATIPSFARVGTKLDVSVASVGSATSLEGGTLIMTALKGADDKVYAMAQGKLTLEKKEMGPGKAAWQAKNNGLLAQGALLEREVPQDWGNLNELRYQLLHPDFTTSVRMARRINEELAGKFATPIDAGTVEVLIPYQFEGTAVDLAAQIESIQVETDVRARVVVNPRTGTVVLGDNVRILPVAIAHNQLRLEVKEPAPREPAGDPDKDVILAPPLIPPPPPPSKKSLIPAGGGATLSELVAILNETGATPDDLITLLRSLKASGALQADLEVL